MRLLIVTQAVDTEDSALGFFHRWIEEFAKHCEVIHVVCLREGTHNLPENVYVHSLGKEGGRSRVKYLVRLYQYAWSLRNEYDAVFVHMNPQYVVLAGALWRLWQKPVGLWYVHRARTMWLRGAALLATVLFTSARESLRVTSPKVQVVGHAIDVDAYAHLPQHMIDQHRIRLVALGRITPIKNLEVVLESLKELEMRGARSTLDIIGEAVMPADFPYEKKLRAYADELGIAKDVAFRGPVSHQDVPKTLASYDVSVNACPTGGIDKTVLESVMAGTATVVSNEAFKSYFVDDFAAMYFREHDASDLAERIMQLVSRNDAEAYRDRLKKVVAQTSDMHALIPRILNALHK